MQDIRHPTPAVTTLTITITITTIIMETMDIRVTQASISTQTQLKQLLKHMLLSRL